MAALGADGQGVGAHTEAELAVLSAGPPAAGSMDLCRLAVSLRREVLALQLRNIGLKRQMNQIKKAQKVKAKSKENGPQLL